MRAQLSRRNVVLGILLAATLAVSAWTLLSSPDEAVVEPTARPPVKAPVESPGSASNASPRAAASATTPPLPKASTNDSTGTSPANADARRALPGASPLAGAGELSLAARPGAPTAITNLFGGYSYQAPGPVAAAPAPPRPHAPPLPFTYTGRLEIDGKDTYLFLQGDAPVSASVGSVIGDFTLVEANGQNLVFLHGPTGERVPLSIAAVGG